jgi:hypothetical protein
MLARINLVAYIHTDIKRVITMKTLFAFALVLSLSGGVAMAQGYNYHQGYTTQNGTYVQPHYQTNPNNTTTDNELQRLSCRR